MKRSFFFFPVLVDTATRPSADVSTTTTENVGIGIGYVKGCQSDMRPFMDAFTIRRSLVNV